MIKVCDAIMGSGKSSAAIRYMNENPDKRFIYITPYLKEADRIKDACPNCHFSRPSEKNPEYKFSIRNHTAALIKQGRSIATTHQAFKFYTDEMKQDIAELGYTLIIDENIELMESVEFSVGDLETCIQCGYAENVGGEIKLGSVPYKGNAKEYRRFISILKCRRLLCLSDSGAGLLYYWLLPPDLLTSFRDVIIMTYMFEGQETHHILNIYELDYAYIYIDRDEVGFKFSETPGYFPEYARHLRDRIHILDNKKLNMIGDSEHALSCNWCDRSDNKSKIEQLKNDIVNYFKHIAEVPVSERMWSCFSGARGKLKGRGYTKSFVSFNERATNEYKNKTTLVYAVNIYMNVPKKLYFQANGINVDEDLYALSTMVQWIWRSAIRNGEEINVYVPSRRMRTLLINWMDSLAEGGDPYAGKSVPPMHSL